MERRADDAEHDAHLDRGLAIFQPRTSRELTREDMREIDRNLTGLFRLLLRWRLDEIEEERRTAGLGNDDLHEEDVDHAQT